MFEEFYENWINKANGYSENVLRDIFDKYLTLFVVYNCEYNSIASETNRYRISDRFAATESIVKYLGADYILDKMKEKGLNIEIGRIIELMETNRFNINLKRGIIYRANDLTIIEKLRSDNENLKAIAILEVIYYVRCNLIHGHKQYEEYQQELLLPLTRILNELVIICRDRILCKVNN